MPATASSLTLEFFSATDTGRARNNNEDSVAIDDATALLVPVSYTHLTLPTKRIV